MSAPDKTDTFWEGLSLNYTPDTAERRYGGPVKIFFAGSFSDAVPLNKFYQENDLKHQGDCQSVSFKAITQGKFCLYENLNKKAFPFDDFLFIKHHDFVGPQPLTSRLVRGRIISCSLKALSAFDRYFRNTIATQRIPIRTNPLHSNGISTAYTYIHRLPYLFNQDGSSYTVKKEVKMTPHPVATTPVGQAYF